MVILFIKALEKNIIFHKEENGIVHVWGGHYLNGVII